MKLIEVISRVIKISLLPSMQWKVIRDQQDSNKMLLWEYGFPIILFSAIGRSIGLFFTIKPVLGFSWELVSVLFFNLISWVAIPYLLLISATFLISITLPRIGIETSLNRTLKLVLYTFTPLFVVTFLVYLHPLMRIMIPLGLYIFIAYTLYIYWYGVQELFQISLEKKIGFIVVTICIAFGAIFIAQHIYAQLIDWFLPGMAAYVK
ncbi:MAG: DUF1282 family protein [Bacteroidetes bacterium]|nr:DUF1282 family protein [Bacteroidota bacterium]